MSEVYDALAAAGAPGSKACAAAEAIPATKQEFDDLKSNIGELWFLFEDWCSVVVTHAELHRSQCELKAGLNAERWKSTVLQIVATVVLAVAPFSVGCRLSDLVSASFCEVSSLNVWS